MFSNGEPVNLPPKVFDTLHALVVKSGHIVERDELMSEVWKETFVEEANLSVNISALRKTLGKNEQGNDFIETVPRRGYRFRAKVLEYPGDIYSDEMMVVHRRLHARIVTTDFDDENLELPGNEPQSLAASSTPIKTVAVLPFQLIKAEEGDEYLSLSLAEALIMQLGSTGRFVVRPATAVRKYAGTDQTAFEAGRELQVDAVLESSISRIGNKLRVSATMLEIRSEISLWSDKFDIEFGDIFAVQDSIAEQVIRSLTLRLNEREREMFAKRYTTDAGAFREYLKGRYFWNKRDVPNFYKAINHFKHAIDLDPTYALPYTGLADTYNMLPMWGEMSPREGYTLAKAAALKALEIDSEIAEAHSSLGYTKYLYDWDFTEVERCYRRALALNPNCVSARNWYAKLFVTLKRFDEASEQMNFAYDLDPLSPMVASSAIAVSLYARRYDEAIEKYQKLLKQTPNFVPALIGIGLAYAATGAAVEAIAAHQAAVEHSTGNYAVAGVMAGTKAMFGDRESAQKTIDELVEIYPKFNFLTYIIASIYARLGDSDESFAWLDRAFDFRVSHVVDLSVDPEFDNLRSDTRFNSLLDRIFNIQSLTSNGQTYSLEIGH
ncbi:N/A [soil metagenome]